MGVVAEQVPSNSAYARILANHRPMLRRWGYATALVVGLVAIFMSCAHREIENVAQLERLVAKIERAQTLSPEAKETINRLIARQSIGGGRGDPSHQMRRKAAIERVTTAVQAKESVAAASNVAVR